MGGDELTADISGSEPRDTASRFATYEAARRNRSANPTTTTFSSPNTQNMPQPVHNTRSTPAT